jgi:hypothetical protein
LQERQRTTSGPLQLLVERFGPDELTKLAHMEAMVQVAESK